jgi:hypothetical protein
MINVKGRQISCHCVGKKVTLSHTVGLLLFIFVQCLQQLLLYRVTCAVANKMINGMRNDPACLFGFE